MKIRKYLIIAAALAIVSFASVGTTLAYFTDSKEATGGVTLSLGDSRIEPTEKVEGMIKHITVKNTGKYDVFIRIKAVYGSNFTVTPIDGNDGDWIFNKDDGYYYYKNVVKAEQTAPQLDLKVDVINDSIVKEDFHIVIVQEATLAIYDEEGNASADWTKKVMSRSDYDAKFTEKQSDSEEPEQEATETPDIEEIAEEEGED